MSVSGGSNKKMVPIKEGLFHMPESPDDEPYLIGSKCRECGCVVWPTKKVCPACVKDDIMEEVPLSRKAKLQSFSVVYQVPTGFDFDIPYIQATVRLPEGVTLFTLVAGVEARSDALKLDQEMEMIIGKIREDEEGNDVVSWKFRPVQ
jgi:uncharacterized OB-fold protein